MSSHPLTFYAGAICSPAPDGGDWRGTVSIAGAIAMPLVGHDNRTAATITRVVDRDVGVRGRAAPAMACRRVRGGVRHELG
jgi:hypothetical protein